MPYIKFRRGRTGTATRTIEIGKIGERGENEWTEEYTPEELLKVLMEESGHDS